MTNSFKSTVRGMFAAALLLSAQAVRSDIHDRIEYKLNRVLKDVDIIINGSSSSCTSITQQDINDGAGSYVITESGTYCLSENVVGTIVAENIDCVCLNLSCHEISAGGAPNAIVFGGCKGVSVFNGCISDSSEAGILINDCSGVSLSDLQFEDHTVSGIDVGFSNAVKVQNVNFVAAGDRALRIADTNNTQIAQLSVVGFTSTVGAILELARCSAVSINNISISNCTKSIVSANNPFSYDARFVSMDACSAVDAFGMKVTNNVINNSVVGSKVFQAIGVSDSLSLYLRHCEISDNSDINGGTATDSQLFVGRCNGVVITTAHANRNTCTSAIDNFYGIHLFEAEAAVLGDCQVSDNNIAALNVYPSTPSSMIAIFSESPAGDVIIGTTEASFNSCDDGGTRIPGDAVGQVAGFVLYGKAFMNKCQANNNFMGTNGAATTVSGALFAQSLDVGVESSYFNDNRGGEFAAGLRFMPTPEVDEAARTVINSFASFNNGYGVLAQEEAEGDQFVSLQLDGCLFSDNTHDTLQAAGVAISVPGANDIYIRSCEITGNSSGGAPAYGVYVANATNVQVSGCHILNTDSDTDEAHGILFDSIVDGEVFRTQVDSNKSSGIELIGLNTGVVIMECLAQSNDVGFSFAPTSTAECCLVQDCRAVRNATFGFEHAAEAPFTTVYIGNEAQCNGAGFTEENFAPPLTALIGLQELSLFNGDLTIFNGNAALGARFTNISGIFELLV